MFTQFRKNIGKDMLVNKKSLKIIDYFSEGLSETSPDSLCLTNPNPGLSAPILTREAVFVSI